MMELDEDEFLDEDMIDVKWKDVDFERKRKWLLHEMKIGKRG